MTADLKLLHIAKAICLSRSLTFIGEVGAGAFKHTFETRLPDGTQRALKLYRRTGADARTAREVEAIRRCSHPGIAHLEHIEVWSDGSEEYVFLIEEFLSGGTLTAQMAEGVMESSRVRALALCLIDAVGHIASLGLVHRDIKPDNLMFRSPGGAPVIVDFGLVRDLRQSSLTKTWLPHGPGTPYFAAPEQLNNEKPLIDWRTDQFALGVVLAICGLGRHPYSSPGSPNGQAVDRVARREQPSADFVAWAARSGLSPLIRMVEPWSVKRFRTPQQLAEAWQNEEQKYACLSPNGT